MTYEKLVCQSRACRDRGFCGYGCFIRNVCRSEVMIEISDLITPPTPHTTAGEISDGVIITIR